MLLNNLKPQFPGTTKTIYISLSLRQRSSTSFADLIQRNLLRKLKVIYGLTGVSEKLLLKFQLGSKCGLLWFSQYFDYYLSVKKYFIYMDGCGLTHNADMYRILHLPGQFYFIFLILHKKEKVIMLLQRKSQE